MRAASLTDVKSLLQNTEALEILIETLKLYKYWQNFPHLHSEMTELFLLMPSRKKILPEAKTHCGALQSK